MSLYLYFILFFYSLSFFFFMPLVLISQATSRVVSRATFQFLLFSLQLLALLLDVLRVSFLLASYLLLSFLLVSFPQASYPRSFFLLPFLLSFTRQVQLLLLRVQLTLLQLLVNFFLLLFFTAQAFFAIQLARPIQPIFFLLPSVFFLLPTQPRLQLLPTASIRLFFVLFLFFPLLPSFSCIPGRQVSPSFFQAAHIWLLQFQRTQRHLFYSSSLQGSFVFLAKWQEPMEINLLLSQNI